MTWVSFKTTRAVISTGGDNDIELGPSGKSGHIELKFGGCLVHVDANDLIHAAERVALDAGIEVSK